MSYVLRPLGRRHVVAVPGAFIRSYLSPQHRDQCADGCPSAALLDEIARRPAATRQVFTDELMGVIDDIASRLDPTLLARGVETALKLLDDRA